MAKKPKAKCCVSKPRCKRCPLRMLAQGTLPEGYTVKKRRLVAIDGGSGSTVAAKKKSTKAKKKGKKSQKSQKGDRTKLVRVA